MGYSKIVFGILSLVLLLQIATCLTLTYLLYSNVHSPFLFCGIIEIQVPYSIQELLKLIWHRCPAISIEHGMQIINSAIEKTPAGIKEGLEKAVEAYTKPKEHQPIIKLIWNVNNTTSIIGWSRPIKCIIILK